MINYGLPQRTIDELTDYFKSKPEIKKVIIYGSRAKGNCRNGSDVDFAIISDDDTRFFRIAGELDDLPTPYMFDVINYNSLTDNDNIKKSIDEFGKIFYERKGEN